MLLQTLSAILPDLAAAGVPQAMGPWLAMLGFGAYHGLNPGMGWLFALSLGLQQQRARAIWVSLLPIALGHAASLALAAAIVLAGVQFLSMAVFQGLTAMLLIGFGVYKVFNYYRHPRWVGMKVDLKDLTWWSFLMATAHGAGLMIGPTLLGVASFCSAPGARLPLGAGLSLAILAHTVAMLAVMSAVAWIVYKKLGLAVLRHRWVNFDLIWAVALICVGGIAIAGVFWPGHG